MKSVFFVVAMVATTAFAGLSEQSAALSGASAAGVSEMFQGAVNLSQQGWASAQTLASDAGRLSVAGMEGVVSTLDSASKATSAATVKVAAFVSDVAVAGKDIVVQFSTEAGTFSVGMSNAAGTLTSQALEASKASGKAVIVYVVDGQLTQDITSAGQAVSGATSNAVASTVTASMNASNEVSLAITTGAPISNEMTQGIN